MLLNQHAVGGTQLNAIDLATALRPHGYSCFTTVYGEESGTGELLEEYASSRGIPIRVLERPRTGLLAARQSTQVARDVRADLVHVYGNSHMIRDAYWGPARLGRRAMVMTIYDMKIADNVPRHQPMIVGTGYQLDERLRDQGG